MGVLVKFEKRKKRTEQSEAAVRWWDCLPFHKWGPWKHQEDLCGEPKLWEQYKTCIVCGKTVTRTTVSLF